MGKLDAAAPAGAVVNGPEDAVVDWDAVDWRQVEDDVRRLVSGSSRHPRQGT